MLPKPQNFDVTFVHCPVFMAPRCKFMDALVAFFGSHLHSVKAFWTDLGHLFCPNQCPKKSLSIRVATVMAVTQAGGDSSWERVPWGHVLGLVPHNNNGFIIPTADLSRETIICIGFLLFVDKSCDNHGFCNRQLISTDKLLYAWVCRSLMTYSCCTHGFYNTNG